MKHFSPTGPGFFLVKVSQDAVSVGHLREWDTFHSGSQIEVSNNTLDVVFKYNYWKGDILYFWGPCLCVPINGWSYSLMNKSHHNVFLLFGKGKLLYIKLQ